MFSALRKTSITVSDITVGDPADHDHRQDDFDEDAASQDAEDPVETPMEGCNSQSLHESEKPTRKVLTKKSNRNKEEKVKDRPVSKQRRRHATVENTAFDVVARSSENSVNHVMETGTTDTTKQNGMVPEVMTSSKSSNESFLMGTSTPFVTAPQVIGKKDSACYSISDTDSDIVRADIFRDIHRDTDRDLLDDTRVSAHSPAAILAQQIDCSVSHDLQRPGVSSRTNLPSLPHHERPSVARALFVKTNTMEEQYFNENEDKHTARSKKHLGPRSKTKARHGISDSEANQEIPKIEIT